MTATITRARSRAGDAVRTARITGDLVWFMASARRRDDPYAIYARLRRLERVHRSPIGVWLVSGHAECNQLLRDPRMSSNEAHIELDTLNLGPLQRILGRPQGGVRGPFMELADKLLLFLDPPDHTRLRHLVNRSFTPRRVHELEVRIREIADELLAPLVDAGRCDLMRDFAYPFPARVICELIGVPADEAERIIEPAPGLAAGLEPGPMLTSEALAAADAAAVAITTYLRDLIDRRRRDAGDDLLSALLHAEGDALTEDELVGIVMLLLVAGHETTANLLGNGTVALLSQPAALAALRASADLDEAAVDELLRFDSPVQMTMRIATEDVEVAGRVIDKGTAVVLVTGAANHDETVFSHAATLDWHRPSNPHLAFGGGIHYCLGAQLARTEARIGLRAVLDTLPPFRLAAEPVHRPSFTVRGLERLELTWA